MTTSVTGRSLPRIPEDFLPFPENRAALLAVRRIAHRSVVPCGTIPPRLSPLFIHGPPGVGKSHLINGLFAWVARTQPDRILRRITANELNELCRNYRSRTPAAVAAWRELYAPDILSVEDCQHFNERGADLFADLIDRRRQHGWATILTGLIGPGGLSRLPRRLTSRLASGLVVGIAPLSQASRSAWLRRHPLTARLRLSEEMIALLVQHTPGPGLRGLVGRLPALEQFQRAVGRPLTLDLIRSFLNDEPNTTRPLERILHKVAEHFRVTPKEIISSGRQRQIVHARRIAVYLSRTLTTHSLTEIGSFFGGRDHSTILHTYRKTGELLDDDAELAGLIAAWSAELS